MSATGLEVFDKTLQTTNAWLNEIMEKIGPDRQVAWHVLGAVLRTIRDRIPMELSAHLSAELPMLVRGLYFDQWRATTPQEKYRSQEEFFEHLTANMGPIRPVGARDAATAVFEVLNRHLDEGQTRKVREALPEEMRALWPEKVMERQG